MVLLSAKQVAERLSCSVSYVYKLMAADSKFPKPIYIGFGGERARGARWHEEAIDTWISNRPAHPPAKDN